MEISWRHEKGFLLDEKTTRLSEDLPSITRGIVLDGLYQLDHSQELERHVESIYWKDEKLIVRRGTWFYGNCMQPLDEDLADVVEDHHLANFRGQAVPHPPTAGHGKESGNVCIKLRIMLISVLN